MGDMGNHAQLEAEWMLKMFRNHTNELLRSFIFKLRLTLLICKPLINEEQIACLLRLYNQAGFAFTNYTEQEALLQEKPKARFKLLGFCFFLLLCHFMFE